MASYESINMFSSSSVQEDDCDHPHNLSRLSMCTSSVNTNEDDHDDIDVDEGMGMMFMSRLSLESFDADVDEEVLSDKEANDKAHRHLLDLSSDSDKELSGCYSLPATPPRRRTRGGRGSGRGAAAAASMKEYASENEVQNGNYHKGRRRKYLSRRRRAKVETWGDDVASGKSKKDDQVGNLYYGYSNSFSGESEGGGCGGGGGLVVITRPKGGSRSLCMDLEEVKACRDLGFELEHERMLEVSSCRVSISGSTNFDTASSGGNSPIANWRISSPGDDPRDVKARLKVWAQAVALASASRHAGI